MGRAGTDQKTDGSLLPASKGEMLDWSTHPSGEWDGIHSLDPDGYTQLDIGACNGDSHLRSRLSLQSELGSIVPIVLDLSDPGYVL
jgi:hypothetical protein